MDGVDDVFFGLADLSQDLGVDRIADRDRLIVLWQRVVAAARAAGVRVGRRGATASTASGATCRRCGRPPRTI